MPDWLWAVTVLGVAGGAAYACFVVARRAQPPECVPSSQLRHCGPQAPTNHIPECCRAGVHSPFWEKGFTCRYCGAPSLVEPEPPTIPDHLWKPGA